VVAGDGQVTMGDTVLKHKARKVRRLYHDKVIAGFAGTTADAFTLFERFEAKLEQYSGNLRRAAVELAKDWRTDRMLRRLEALLAAVDSDGSLVISGTGDVIEPDDGLLAIGSGAPKRWLRRVLWQSILISMPARLPRRQWRSLLGYVYIPMMSLFLKN